MSAEYKGQNPLDIAKQAEKDLNSHANVHGTDPNTTNTKKGTNASDSGTLPHQTSKSYTLLTSSSNRVRHRRIRS